MTSHEDTIKQVVRKHLGPSTIRFTNTGATVTTKAFPTDNTRAIEFLRGRIESILSDTSHDEPTLGTWYAYKIISPSRFKLIRTEKTYLDIETRYNPELEAVLDRFLDDLDLDDAALENLDSSEIESVSELIRVATDAAHEEVKAERATLESLQLEALDDEVNEFARHNFDDALVLCNSSIDIEDIKAILRLGYIGGVWARSATRDIPVLKKYFLERYASTIGTLYSNGERL